MAPTRRQPRRRARAARHAVRKRISRSSSAPRALPPSPRALGHAHKPGAVAIVMKPQRQPVPDRDNRKLRGGVDQLPASVAPLAIADTFDRVMTNRSGQDTPPRVVAGSHCSALLVQHWSSETNVGPCVRTDTGRAISLALRDAGSRPERGRRVILCRTVASGWKPCRASFHATMMSRHQRQTRQFRSSPPRSPQDAAPVSHRHIA